MNSADFADFKARHCLDSFVCRGSSKLQVSDVEKAVKCDQNMCTCGSKMTIDNKNACRISQEVVGSPLPVS